MEDLEKFNKTCTDSPPMKTKFGDRKGGKERKHYKKPKRGSSMMPHYRVVL